MPSPTYTLNSFQYLPGVTPNLKAAISQTIDGLVWTLNKSISGDAALNIWNHRGDTEAQLIALIMA